jgi:peptidyl-prolyl cis-trans isomerase D
MLDSMRAATQTWFGRAVMAVIMGFIILSFSIWGIGDIFRGFGANDLAKVGHTNISVEAYRNAYQTELQRLQRQARRAITNDEARAAGLDRQVLSRLINEAAFDQKAHDLGLAISDQQIAASIVKDDAFKDPAGHFDRTRFQELLRDNGFTERSFVADQRNVYLRREMADPITEGVQVPQAMIAAIHRFQSEARSVDYVVLPASVAGEPPAPAEEELKSYYQAREQNYRTPEYRKLVVLTLTAAKLAANQQISDADLQKRYEEVKDQQFVTPEQRTLEQISYPDEATASAARAQLAAGKSFKDLADERKLTQTDINLGTVSKASMVDKAVADAAFALTEGQVSEPVKAQFGTVLLRVTKVIPGSARSFADVSGILRQELAAIRARKEIGSLRDSIEDQRSSGKSLTEAAKSAGLEAQTVEAVDAAGRDKAGAPVAAVAGEASLLKAAFASDIGVDNDTLSTKDGGTLWYEVAGIDPAHQQSFDEVKTEVEAAWKADEIAKRLSAKAADWIKKIGGGQSLKDLIASEGGLEMKHADDVKRSGGGGLPQGAVAQIFNVPVKGAESAAAGDSRIVFQVLASRVPPLEEQSPELKSLTEQVKSSMTNEILGQYLSALQKDLGLKINSAAMATAFGAPAENF